MNKLTLLLSTFTSTMVLASSLAYAATPTATITIDNRLKTVIPGSKSPEFPKGLPGVATTSIGINYKYQTPHSTGVSVFSFSECKFGNDNCHSTLPEGQNTFPMPANTIFTITGLTGSGGGNETYASGSSCSNLKISSPGMYKITVYDHYTEYFKIPETKCILQKTS